MKNLLSILLLLSACSTEATSHHYIDCTWHIPAGYEQLSENEYRKIPPIDDLSLAFSSVLFSQTVPDELTRLIEMNTLPDTEVLVISHPDDGRYSYQSIFIHFNRQIGETINTDILRVSAKNQVVELMALSETDSTYVTSACVPSAVLDQHFTVKKQLAQGISSFLSTMHGLNVVIPQPK